MDSQVTGEIEAAMEATVAPEKKLSSTNSMKGRRAKTYSIAWPKSCRIHRNKKATFGISDHNTQHPIPRGFLHELLDSLHLKSKISRAAKKQPHSLRKIDNRRRMRLDREHQRNLSNSSNHPNLTVVAKDGEKVRRTGITVFNR